MTHRIEPLFMNLFSMWLKELKSFCSMTPRVQLFLCSNMTQRVELLFIEYDSKNWTFLKCNSKNWTFEPCVKKRTQRMELFENDFLKWLIELNLFFGTFSRWLKELKSFFNVTQRIEPFVFSQNVSKNWTFFSQNAQRIEPLFHSNYFFTWLKELNFFSQFDSKSWVFSNMTQRIEPLFEYDSKNWIFVRYIRLKGIEPSFFLVRINESNTFLHVTHVFKWFKELIFFFWKISQRIDFSYYSQNGTWRKDLKFMFLKFDSKNWIFFWWLADLKLFLKKEIMAKRIFFEKYDSKNWTLFFCMTQRIEPLKNTTQRIEPFLYESKNWTLFLYDAKNWTFLFWIWRRELNLFFFICRKEMNFCCQILIRIEPFFSK